MAACQKTFSGNVTQGTARFTYVNLSRFTHLVYTPSFRGAVCTLLRGPSLHTQFTYPVYIPVYIPSSQSQFT